MLRFTFKVNSSFLSSPSHPITVPRTQIDYLDLEGEGLDRGSLTVVCPDGTSVSGKMYSGTAGFGPYYQIIMEVPKTHPLLGLPIGFRLSVELERVNNIRWVRLRPLGSGSG
jgi:hypothetical protein